MLKKGNSFINSAVWNNPGFVLSLTIITYFLFVIIRFVIFSLFVEPGALGDDYIYKGMALSFFKTGNFDTLNYAPKVVVPNYLYPLVISPAFFFGENFYIFMKLINSLLINSAIFPVFLLSKEFTSYKKAYFISVMALLIPFMNIGYVLMCESLYLPLFLLGFYWCYKLLSGLKLKYAFLTGIIMALLYLTKPHGLFFIVTFLLTAIVLLFSTRDNVQRKRIIHLTTVSMSCAIVSFLILNIIILGNTGLDLKHYLKIVGRTMDPALLFQSKFIYLMLSHISLFFMLYLFPFLVAVFSLKKTIKEGNSNKQAILLMGLIFSQVMFVVVLILALNSSVYLEDLRIPTRFYFMIYPFYIMAFAAFYKQIEWNKRQKIIMTISFVLTLITNVFIFIPKIILAQKYCHIVTSTDVGWIFSSQHQWGKPGFILFFLVQLLGLAVLVYYLFWKSKAIYPYFVFFLIIAIISNYAAMEKIGQKNRRLQAFRKNYLSFVREKIPLHSQNVALISPRPYYEQGYFSFWLHYDYTTALELKEHTTITNDMIPDNTRWALIEGNYNFGFPVKARFNRGKYTIIQIPKRGFDVKNGILGKGELGYILSAPEGQAALAVRDTLKNYSKKLKICFKMRTLIKKGVMNGAVLIGNTSQSKGKNFISAWILAGSKKFGIYEIGVIFGVKRASAPANFISTKTFDVKIELDFIEKTIIMWVDDKKVLTTGYTGDLAVVNQVGFCVVNTKTTFSKIAIEGQ